MSSYIFYSSILFFSTLSAYLYEKSTDYKKSIFYFFAFFIPFIFIAIRFNMGSDYENYVDIFNDISSGKNLRIEYGYILLNRLIQEFGLSIEWVFAVMGFFTIYYSYKSLPKEGFAIGVFLFITIYYFQGSYNQIRQGLAIAIMAYAFKFIYDKNLFKYTLYSVVSGLFHFPTAIILFIIYFIVNNKINRYIMISIVVIVFALVEQNLITNYIKIILEKLMPQYSYYLDGKFGESVVSKYGVIVVLIHSLIAVIIFYNKDIIIDLYPKANIIINLYLFYIVFYLLKLNIQILTRLQYIFIFSLIISLVYFIKSLSNNNRALVTYILFTIYFASFIKYIYYGDIYKKDTTQIRPYKNIIFDKGKL